MAPRDETTARSPDRSHCDQLVAQPFRLQWAHAGLSLSMTTTNQPVESRIALLIALAQPPVHPADPAGETQAC